jgi:molybdopterin converting factor small subunit
VIDAAVAEFGPNFARVVESSRIWRNGEQAELADPVNEDDEVAVLPPVSGGS